MNYIYNTEQEIFELIENQHGIKIRKRIENLPVEDKRIAMFAAICSKKSVELKNMINTLKTSTEEQIIKQLDIIIERFRKYIPVGNIEKKAFGEVFTPFKLVNEMLDTLPEEVWSNPNLKWADLCNGMGNFMIVVARRLMDGLRQWQPNEGKRWKHIMENMIYVAELQPKNMFLWILSVDPKSKLKLNVYTGDSLKMNIKDVWGIDGFDIMVSNSPYQELKEGFKKSQPIWNLFVKKYLEILNDDGYMVMIHPSGWRNVDGIFKDIQNLLKKRQLLYLSIHNEKDGLKTFGADTRYDYYCLKNVKNSILTKIEDQDGNIENIDISNMEFIPNSNFDIIKNIIANNTEKSVEVLHSFSNYETRKPYMSKEKNDINKYPCVYTVKNGDTLTFFYSSINNNGHFNIPKLIWSNGRVISVGSYIDDIGEYGLTQFSYAIVDDVENLENIKKAFDSKKFRKLMESCSVSDMSINKKIIATFKKDFWKEFI